MLRKRPPIESYRDVVERSCVAISHSDTQGLCKAISYRQPCAKILYRGHWRRHTTKILTKGTYKGSLAQGLLQISLHKSLFRDPVKEILHASFYKDRHKGKQNLPWYLFAMFFASLLFGVSCRDKSCSCLFAGAWNVFQICPPFSTQQICFTFICVEDTQSTYLRYLHTSHPNSEPTYLFFAFREFDFGIHNFVPGCPHSERFSLVLKEAQKLELWLRFRICTRINLLCRHHGWMTLWSIAISAWRFQNPFRFVFFSSKYTIYCGRFCTNNALRHAKLKYSAGKTFPRLNFHEFSALFVAVYL